MYVSIMRLLLDDVRKKKKSVLCIPSLSEVKMLGEFHDMFVLCTQSNFWEQDHLLNSLFIGNILTTCPYSLCSSRFSQRVWCKAPMFGRQEKGSSLFDYRNSRKFSIFIIEADGLLVLSPSVFPLYLPLEPMQP